MSDNITKEHVEGAFNRLCKALGKSTDVFLPDNPTMAHGKRLVRWNVGAWRLDYYGGYQVEEICNEGGGISHPLNRRRMTASEFYYACDFAIEALRIAGKKVQ
jgi:hypothetical protein